MSDSDALSRLYRRLPVEEPSTRLDAKVLAAVNAELSSAREQRARWQRRWRYQVPLATAATLVLAVALLLRQPGSERELMTTHGEMRAPASGYMAYGKREPLIADEMRAELPPSAVMSPPPPAPVPPPVQVPAPPPPVAAMLDMPAPAAMPEAAPEPPAARIAAGIAATGPMGFIADRAFRPLPLAALLKAAPGMAAPEFCQHLRGLWPATDTAPDCPTSDGQHAWPAPLAVSWQVDKGRVVQAELPR